MKNTETKLPKWFKGQHYRKGDIVRNPFSGEEYKLNAEELSMYDFIMGTQMMFDMGLRNEKIIDEFDKGLRWFRKNNAKAYMVLLD